MRRQYREPPKTPTVQDALSALLGSLGFGAMARQVLTESATDKLRLYGQIIVKHTPAERRAEISARLSKLGLL